MLLSPRVPPAPLVTKVKRKWGAHCCRNTRSTSRPHCRMIDCCDCPMCHTYTYLLPLPQHPHFELARSPTAPLSLSPPTSTSITPHHHHIDPSSPPPLSSLRLSPPPQCCCCCSTLLGPPTSSSPSTRRSLRSRSIMTSWIHRRVKCSVCTS